MNKSWTSMPASRRVRLPESSSGKRRLPARGTKCTKGKRHWIKKASNWRVSLCVMGVVCVFYRSLKRYLEDSKTVVAPCRFILTSFRSTTFHPPVLSTAHFFPQRSTVQNNRLYINNGSSKRVLAISRWAADPWPQVYTFRGISGYLTHTLWHNTER